MVDLVSDSLYDAGEAQITIVVLALPPKDSWRILVNFESLEIWNAMKLDFTGTSEESRIDKIRTYTKIILPVRNVRLISIC